MLVASALLPLALALSQGQAPLFSFAQTSDSQPDSAADQQQFEEVLDAIVASGRSGALLRNRVAFVLFAGDLVSSSRTDEWTSWVDTVDARLTANGIALLAVPGNHDQASGSFALYEQFIGSTAPWSAGCAALTGHNGIAVATGWEGLRFIGLNNSNGDYNQVSSGDRADVEARVDAAVADAENVFLMAHHPHDAEGRIPLLAALETPGVIGYLRGHSGSPRIRHGLTGVDNDDLWEFNTNALYEDGALVYVEAFASELHAYVLELRTDPTSLPPRVVVPLLHELRPVDPGPGPGGTVRLTADADAEVNSGQPGENYGLEPELRLRDDGGTNRWSSFVRFDLSAIQVSSVVSARLRLLCTDASTDGGTLYATSSAWSETAITHANAPFPGGAPLLASRPATEDDWSELDVTAAVRSGVRSFALISGSSNGAKYASRETAEAPELALELATTPPLAIHAVVPATVPVLDPGTEESVSIQGAGFAAGVELELDDATLDPGSFTVVDGATITVDLPPASVGAHTLRVRRGTETASAPIQVVLTAGPRLQVGTGDPLNPIASGQPLELVVSGPVGVRQIVVMSLSPVPSSHPLVEFLIGNGFAELKLVASLVIPPSGHAEHVLMPSAPVPLTVYAQSASLGTAPFATSALQSFRLLP